MKQPYVYIVANKRNGTLCDGPTPIVAIDEEARAEAVLRVLAYLKAHLE